MIQSNRVQFAALNIPAIDNRQPTANKMSSGLIALLPFAMTDTVGPQLRYRCDGHHKNTLCPTTNFGALVRIVTPAEIVEEFGFVLPDAYNLQ